METSQAALTFAEAIKDAEHLLGHFDKLNTKPPPPELEVLKRAGLIMAMTAWETYVEDRAQEAAAIRLGSQQESEFGDFVRARLEEDIKRLHNPTSEKALQIFRDYACMDVSAHWTWNHVTADEAKQRLNAYLKLRGDVVHRSVVNAKGEPPHPHAVTRQDLHKAIYFLKQLVGATEKALASGD